MASGQINDIFKLHARYQQQARWTEPLRRYVFERLKLKSTARVLEVGCGTGAVISTLSDYTQASRVGLDLNLEALSEARTLDPSAPVCVGNALALPFAEGAFDGVYSHFLLLWVSDPAQALAEMRRVCKAGGSVIAFAEPDYSGRVDYPMELVEPGRLQSDSLRARGANPDLGRELPALFQQAGLEQIETGVLGGRWQNPPPADSWQLEWETLENDLRGRVDEAHLAGWREANRQACQTGARVLYVPTFYAIGVKKTQRGFHWFQR